MKMKLNFSTKSERLEKFNMISSTTFLFPSTADIAELLQLL